MILTECRNIVEIAVDYRSDNTDCSKKATKGANHIKLEGDVKCSYDKTLPKTDEPV